MSTPLILGITLNDIYVVLMIIMAVMAIIASVVSAAQKLKNKQDASSDLNEIVDQVKKLQDQLDKEKDDK